MARLSSFFIARARGRRERTEDTKKRHFSQYNATYLARTTYVAAIILDCTMAPTMNNMRNNDRTRANKESVLYMGFKGLDHNDLKYILTKLHTPKEERTRPSKLPRLDENALDAQVARLSSSSKIWKLNFVGNKGIGDEGMKHLHLIPDSVRDLDLSDCNLSPKGVKTLCQFLERNKTITRMALWGNRINNDAARAIGTMLATNDTLQELHAQPVSRWSRDDDGSVLPTRDEEDDMTDMAVTWICRGLSANRTLRHFSFGHQISSDEVECRWASLFALFMPTDSPIEVLEIGLCLREFPSPGTQMKDDMDMTHILWVDYLKQNENLRMIGGDVARTSRDVRYFLELNSVHARRIAAESNSPCEDWLEAVATCTANNISRQYEDDSVDAIYYLVRNKPEMCA